MTINNNPYSVPSNVWTVFESYLPFGCDYVAYCSRYNTSLREYTLLYRKIGSKSISRVVALSNSGGYYTFSESELSNTYDGFVTSIPYYCYSNLKGQGQYTTLPSTNSLVCLMLVVCASLMVLRTVFGGIKLWRSRKNSSVY